MFILLNRAFFGKSSKNSFKAILAPMMPNALGIGTPFSRLPSFELCVGRCRPTPSPTKPLPQRCRCMALVGCPLVPFPPSFSFALMFSGIKSAEIDTTFRFENQLAHMVQFVPDTCSAFGCLPVGPLEKPCSFVGMSSFDANPAVLEEWNQDTTLVNRATTTSRISNILSKKICRADVVENYQLLMPMIKHMGCKPHIESITALCGTFLWKTRPRGKVDVSSNFFAPSFIRGIGSTISHPIFRKQTQNIPKQPIF